MFDFVLTSTCLFSHRKKEKSAAKNKSAIDLNSQWHCLCSRAVILSCLMLLSHSVIFYVVFSCSRKLFSTCLFVSLCINHKIGKVFFLFPFFRFSHLFACALVSFSFIGPKWLFNRRNDCSFTCSTPFRFHFDGHFFFIIAKMKIWKCHGTRRITLANVLNFIFAAFNLQIILILLVIQHRKFFVFFCMSKWKCQKANVADKIDSFLLSILC